MTALKAVIFDLGGVITCDVWEQLLGVGEGSLTSQYGLDPGSAWEAGQQLWKEFAHVTGDWNALERRYWHRFNERLGVQLAVAELVAATEPFIAAVEGTLAVASALKERGIRLAVCSNNTEFWYQRAAAKFGLERVFPPEAVILSCRAGVSKSSPRHEMFEAALAAVGVPAEQALFVDDRAGNVQRALTCGIPALLFPSHAAYGHTYLRHLAAAVGLLD